MARSRVLAAVIAASVSVGAWSAAGVVSGGLVLPAGASPASTAALAATRRARMLDLVQAFGSRRSAFMAPATGTSVALGVPVPAITVHDSVGDAQLPEGDITGAGMAQNSSGTGFAITVDDPVDPSSDPTWQSGFASFAWFIDNTLDDVPDFFTVTVAVGNQLQTQVLNFNDLSVRCNTTGSFVAGSGYRSTVPAGCLPAMPNARFQAGMIYDPTNSQSPLIDFAPDNDLSPPTPVFQSAPRSGYWMLGADGRVYAFGGAVGFPGTVPFATGMAPRRDGKGYWVVDGAGHVFSYGTASFFGGAPALAPGEYVSTISATPNGGGYWLFTNRGRAFPFGNAHSFGDMSGTHLNGPVIASVATPTGDGYYMVGSDGGIFSFGDARFHGSTGGVRLNKPVVGISPTPDGRGYWLVASDGGVFAFNAPFRGSMGGTRLNRPVDGLVAFGNGYLMAASDGGIFDFSNRAFLGSLANHPPSAPIIGLAAFST